MEESRNPHLLSPEEAERFFATGSDARSAESGLKLDVCPHCGPTCYGGAAHNARSEDGVLYGTLPGELPAAAPVESHRNVQGSPDCAGGTGAAGRTEPLVGAGGPETQADGFGGAESLELRCSDCKRLRRATPRHSPDCRFAFQNCPGCVYLGEGHLASCPIASQLKLPTDICCDGVDLPSVGPVHSPDCRNTRPVMRASHGLCTATEWARANLPSAADLDAAAEEQAVAAATRAGAENGTDRRDALLARLVLAARDLASSHITAGGLAHASCDECFRYINAGPHARTCKTGRVLSVLAELIADSEAHPRPQAADLMGGAL